MNLFGSSPEPGHRSAVILLHVAAVLIPLAELRLRLGVPRLGQLAQHSDGQLRDVDRRRIRARSVGRRVGWNGCRHGDRRAAGHVRVK